MDGDNVRNHVMMLPGTSGTGNLLGQSLVPLKHNLVMASSSAMESVAAVQGLVGLPTKQEKDALSMAKVSPYRKTRTRSGNKSENIKGDEKITLLHSRVQEMFSIHLATVLNDSSAQDLQCCVTYGKPCGCIRKFILAGRHWKDSNAPHLRILGMKDKDAETIAANDKSYFGDDQLYRARELLQILHHAAELKKEKCYVASEGADGKPGKELRGMIGLGNGRKRSKKYEEFVLDRRAVLREEYLLCEKAAQKLLGYSINFLYKKLRTNPQRTSRLVATNKAERAAKGPRHLLSLQQLKDMANNQQSSNQCCCRNCITWLVKQHFDKIVNWRKRLEGSGQRVAQEIVAEVLLVSASLDGQNSFCQNLVHWVTGCSFKKIRRVRDHLKKDPKSLPEHGLKKYWKEKGRKQSKARDEDYNKNLHMKTEKVEAFSSGQSLGRFPVPYDTRNTSMPNDPSNLNNSNNRYDNEVQFISNSGTPPPNRTLPPGGMGGVFPGRLTGNGGFGHENMSMYSHLPRSIQQNSNQHLYMAADSGQSSSAVLGSSEMRNIQHNANFNPSLQGSFQEGNSSDFNPPHYKGSMTISGNHGTSTAAQPSAAARPMLEQGEPMQYQEAQSVQQPSFAQGKEEQGKFYPAPFIAGFPDPNANFDHSHQYYFAANPGNSQQDGYIHTGMTPLIFTQPQQVDPNNNAQEDGASTQFAGQQFFLVSPIPHNSEKGGNEFDFKPVVMPLTPIQMYPASYFSSGMSNDNRDGKAWNAEGQHFALPTSESNATYTAPQEQDYVNQQTNTVERNKRAQNVAPNQQQAYFQPALTPLAVMQPQGNNFFSGWLATHPPVSVQQQRTSEPVDEKGQPYVTAVSSSQHYENNSNQVAPDYMVKNEPQYHKEKLPALSQWASTHNQAYGSNQQTGNQWLNEQKKPFVDQTSSQQVATENQSVASTTNVSSTDVNVSLVSLMPPLGPIQTTKADSPNTGSEMLPAVQTFSSSMKNDLQSESTSPKGAAGIGSRSKRFSRDRLGASIDSPGLMPPMTPLTPALTPSILAGIKASAVASTENSVSKTESESTSAHEDDDRPSENSVFRFPPTHISRRMAALRFQGPTTDTAGVENGDKDQEKNVGSTDQAQSSSVENQEAVTTQSASTSINALGYISAPVLSLPATFLSNEAADSKTKASESNTDQHSKSPALNTPTHHLTQLSTPTHPLNTPNQLLDTPTHSLNTPTQPLSTPTQPLNTPTQSLSTPSSASSSTPLTIHDEHSPVKALLPVPVGKKRRAEKDGNNENRTPKYLRFHPHTTDTVEPQPSKTSDAKITHQKPDDSVVIIDDNSNSEENKTSVKVSSSASANKTSTSESTLTIPATPSSIKSPSKKKVPPIITYHPTSGDNIPTTPSTQLNTPVFIPSVFTPGGKLTPALRRGSGSDKSSASTPQFFTFLPSTGFPAPMFFAPMDQIDTKYKSPKGKASDSASDAADKVKSSSAKRGPLPLSLSSKPLADDGLQTPSKIPVVTPSARAGAASDAAPMFSFHEVSVTGVASVSTEKAKASALQAANSNAAKEPAEESGTKHEKISRSKVKLRPPSLVVDPPSDNEEEIKEDTLSESKSSKKTPERSEKQCVMTKGSPVTSKPTLHRTRSGSKKDLILTLDNVNAPDAELADAAASSPLNTPSGIQVITPTLPTASKLTSPHQRFPTGRRGVPQPIVMTPICLTPGGNTSQPQVATPTVFRLFSPNQPTPPSPSVVVYPYPPRGSGPLSTGSIASPAFGFFQKTPVPSGSNSASLLKSALMKKWPVFQFPPLVRAPTPTSEPAAPEKNPEASEKDPDREVTPDKSSSCTVSALNASPEASTTKD